VAIEVARLLSLAPQQEEALLQSIQNRVTVVAVVLFDTIHRSLIQLDRAVDSVDDLSIEQPVMIEMQKSLVLLRKYEHVTTYDGRVILYKATQACPEVTAEILSEKFNGLEGNLSNITVAKVECSHRDIMDNEHLFEECENFINFEESKH
jgi:thioesterase domain-containing protein